MSVDVVMTIVITSLFWMLVGTCALQDAHKAGMLAGELKEFKRWLNGAERQAPEPMEKPPLVSGSVEAKLWD